MGIILQLFNARRLLKQDCDLCGRPQALSPDKFITFENLSFETVLMNSYPVNPFARMHNAYGGLDPVRALWVLVFRRHVACVSGHLESVVIILLLRRMFAFKPKVAIWEVPWSPGWKYRELITRFAVPRADLNIVFSSSQAVRLRQTYGEIPVASIPFCVDTDFFSPMEDVTENGSVLSLGRDYGRDFQTVIAAMAGVDAPLILRTSAPVAVPAEQEAQVRIITDNVSWCELRRMYAQASVVVVAVTETPNTSGVTSLLEALAMGRPVVVTATEPLRDYLPFPEAGVVVESGKPEAIHAAVSALLGDPTRRKLMGIAARRFALECFTPDRHFKHMGNLFDELNKERTTSAAES